MPATSPNPALHGAVLHYAAAVYPVFDAIGRDNACKAAAFCSEWLAECEVARDKKGDFPVKDVPHFGSRSIVFAVAVAAAFIVWTQQGIPMPDGPLLDAAKMGFLLHYGRKP